LDPFVFNVHQVLWKRAQLASKAFHSDATIAVFLCLGTSWVSDAGAVNLVLRVTAEKFAEKWKTAPKKSVNKAITVASAAASTLSVFLSLPLHSVPKDDARTPKHFAAHANSALGDAIAESMGDHHSLWFLAARGSRREGGVHCVRAFAVVVVGVVHWNEKWKMCFIYCATCHYSPASSWITCDLASFFTYPHSLF
jgi:hypothetical protein